MRADQTRLLSLLRQRNFAELETTLGARQSEYEAGKYREESLYYTFEAFQANDAALLPLLIEWTKNYSTSYGARLALGVYRMEMAWAARGDKFRHETSKEQYRLFQQRSRAAAKDLLAAQALTSKPISFFAFAIGNARDRGDADYAGELLKGALALDPGAVMVRSRYVDVIDPRWFGSVEALEKFKRDLAREPLDESSKNYLRFGVEQTIANALRAWKRYPEAERHFRRAAQHCDLPRPWQNLANLYNETKQWREAVDALDNYLRLEPDQAWAIRRKAYALQEIGSPEKAAPLYREAAELGDAYAQNALGWYLMQGIAINKDLDEAKKWFRAAARQGNTDAQINLKNLAQVQAGAPVK